MKSTPPAKFSQLPQLLFGSLLLTSVTLAEDLSADAPANNPSGLTTDMMFAEESDHKELQPTRDIESRWLDLSLPVELPWYRIELLLFINRIADSSHQEQWQAKIEAPFAAQLYSLSMDQNPQIYNAYSEIEPRQLEFNRYASKLDKDENIRVIYHKAWHQPLQGKSQSTPLFIQAGNVFGNEHELEGTVTVSVERYLHIDTDLRFSAFSEDRPLIHEWWLDSTAPGDDGLTPAQQANPFNLPLDTSVQFTPFSEGLVDIETAQQPKKQKFMRTRQVQLKQTRRMKSGELHYLDHPHMGLLVKITPFKLPEQEAPLTP